MANTFFAERIDKILGNPGQSKSAHHDGCAILDVGDRVARVAYDFIHDKPPVGSGCASQSANLATRCTRSGFPMFCSISRTIALPTTAPSACRHTARTCSGLDIPNPTAIGAAVCERRVHRN